jgi:hypothetical protein
LPLRSTALKEAPFIVGSRDWVWLQRGASPGERLTQATFVNALVKYISDDPKQDRDMLLRGETLKLVTGDEEKRLCFRNMFIREKDVQIGKIVEQYFLAVRERWPEAWDAGGKGIMLNQSNGFRALMRLFGEAYNRLALPGNFVSSQRFLELFNRVKEESNYFTIERFKPGSSGEAGLREFLQSEIFGG